MTPNTKPKKTDIDEHFLIVLGALNDLYQECKVQSKSKKADWRKAEELTGDELEEFKASLKHFNKRKTRLCH